MNFIICKTDYKLMVIVKLSHNKSKGWFPFRVNCRRSVKSSLFLHLVLCAHTRVYMYTCTHKPNRETINFSRHACNLCLMETSLKNQLGKI